MTIPVSVSNLVGNWRGANRLWLFPTDPVRESETTMVVSQAAQGRFVTFQYSWAYEGVPQDGLLVVSVDPNLDVKQAFWIDSWHMQDKIMQCHGTVGVQGEISLKGSYPAPPGPDWGWQIDVTLKQDGRLFLVMHNITPEGNSLLTVEAAYSRKL
jgi:hypothetical protein